MAANKGALGENLLKMLVLTNFGVFLTELAVTNSTFHQESAVNGCVLDATSTGNVDEFGLSPMELLCDPYTNLDQRYIKVPYTVKPDGLTLLRKGSSRMIAAFQSKNWNKRLGAADVEKALKSLDPTLFFVATSNARKQWKEAWQAKNWTPYVRVRSKKHVQIN